MDVPYIKPVQLRRYAEFTPFLDHVSGLFGRLGRGLPHPDRTIYVDLFPHGNAGYHISNLLIARYASIHGGAKVVGLTVSDPLFMRFVFESEDILAVARAFGVDEVIDLGADKQTTEHALPPVRDGKGLQALEEKLAGRRYFGLEDRVRRRYQSPSLAGTVVPAEYLTAESALSVAVARRLDDVDISASDVFVTGHVEYDPYRLTALKFLKRSATVLYNWVLQPFTLKRFTNESEMLSNSVGAVKHYFDECLHVCRRLPPGALERLAVYYQASLAGVRPTQVMNRSSGARLQDRSSATVLMAQALSDGVHSYGEMLFEDFADWLQQSVEHAARHEIPMVLRDHPMQHLYDQTGFISRLFDAQRGRNGFELVSGEQPFDPSRYRTCVTTQGTPGIEMPMDGTRAIAVGTARYTGLGIVDEPRSIEEYFSLLSGEPPLSEREIRERRGRAALYGFLELFGFRTVSTFLPNGLKASPKDLMRHITESGSIHSVFSDPLFHQVGCCMNGAQISFNPGLLGGRPVHPTVDGVVRLGDFS